MEHEGLSKVTIEVTVSVPPCGSGQLFIGVLLISVKNLQPSVTTATTR